VEAPEAAGPPPRQWTATGRERPVFLDETGRRRHWVRAGGAVAGLAAAAWFGALVTGPLGFSRLPDVTPTLKIAARIAPPALTIHVRAHRTLNVAVVGRHGHGTLAVLRDHSGSLHGVLAASTLSRADAPES
jgi:hypothetical protein